MTHPIERCPAGVEPAAGSCTWMVNAVGGVTGGEARWFVTVAREGGGWLVGAAGGVTG
ncbi:MAG: hypothetical protein M0Z63_06930 [Actinomycetota bacterium]|nr:hypothetical protein [Actinomycetota bacterium]MDA8280142.1 hypothetical protein [Actinomycetota bacterium]